MLTGGFKIFTCLKYLCAVFSYIQIYAQVFLMETCCVGVKYLRSLLWKMVTVENDDVKGGEGEATASSHTYVDGRETIEEKIVNEDGCSGK